MSFEGADIIFIGSLQVYGTIRLLTYSVVFLQPTSTVCGNQNGESGLQSCLPLGKLSKIKRPSLLGIAQRVQSRKGTADLSQNGRIAV